MIEPVAPTTTAGPPGAPAADVAALGARFTRLADQDLRGYCPIYERIARSLVDDPDTLALLLGLAPVNRTPVLALAATRYLALGEPDTTAGEVLGAGRGGDPWPVFRELRGSARPEAFAPRRPIAWRAGLDLAPVDITDPDQRRWLMACVWPGVPERPERLAAALEVAATDPPSLRRGDAATDLEALLREAPGDLPIAVVSTWALGYLDAAGRQAVADTVDQIGRDREIGLLTAEAAQVTPWTPPVCSTPASGEGADGTPTVLGLRRWGEGDRADRALGVMHPHGRWLAWETAR